MQKTSGFSKFIVYLPRKRGGRRDWASADILRTRGVNFSRFCADVFYGRPLTVYSFTPSGFGQETAKWLFNLRVKPPPADLSIATQWY